MKQLIVALLAAIATLLKTDRSDRDTIAAQKRKIEDLTARLDDVDPALESQVNDTLNQVAAATAGEDAHVEEVAQIEATEVSKEERDAQIAKDVQTRGIAPADPKAYAKSIQRAKPVEDQADTATGDEDQSAEKSLGNENTGPLKDEQGNPLPPLPPLKTAEGEENK